MQVFFCFLTICYVQGEPSLDVSALLTVSVEQVYDQRERKTTKRTIRKVVCVFSIFQVVIFLFCFNFDKMSTPEIEVRSFKQQGGESLKDAWYRISDAHHRCTKKHSNIILPRNFYVGITSWYMYVLDTLTGGNFLGTPAGEARNVIESLCWNSSC